MRYFLIIFSFFSISLVGQSNREFNMVTYYQFEETPVMNFFTNHAAELGIDTDTKMNETYRNIDHLGKMHIKYEQTYKGLNVLEGVYHLHVINNKVEKSTGKLFAIRNMDVHPTIDLKAIKIIAINQWLSYVSDSLNNLDFLTKDTEVIVDELCIIDHLEFIKNDYRLAYSCTVLNSKLHSMYKIFIDAKDGQVLRSYNNIQNQSVPAKGVSQYYGVVDFNTDSIAPNKYILQDLSRGKGIFIRSSWNNLDSLEDDDNFWDYSDEGERSAIDAFYCATAYYDFLMIKFNRNSIDDRGAPMICDVNIKSFVNAYWDGRVVTLGAGDCHNYGPLTTLDVVGHEFTHGLTNYTANLIYQRESGALNESMSDIFGKALEYYYDNPNFDWLIGGRLPRNSSIKPFRSMRDPNSLSLPKFYKGRHWEYNGFFDNYGVHTNSSVLNYWFYLLVEGENGVNEVDSTYSVQSIGMDNAIQIVYHLLVNYLTPGSNYKEAYQYSIEATTDLFGANSNELASVLEAWKAVGIPYNIIPPTDNESTAFNMIINDHDGPFASFCLDELENLELVFHNVGTTTIEEGTLMKLDITPGRPEFSDFIEEVNFERILQKSIPPGASVNFTIHVDTVGFDGLYMSFRFNFQLLKDSFNYRTSNFGNLNIRRLAEDFLSLANMQPIYTCSEQEVVDFNLSILNRGCRQYDTSDSITIEIYNENEVYWIEFLAPAIVFAASSVRNIERYFDFRRIENLEDFKFDIYYNNTLIKTDSFRRFFHYPLEKDVLIDFQDSSYISTIDVVITGNNMSIDIEHEVLHIENHSLLLNLDDCLKPLDYFKAQEEAWYSEFANVEFCIDIEDMKDPVLSFDLKLVDQKNKSTYQNRYLHMLKVTQGSDFVDLISSTKNKYETIIIPLQHDMSPVIKFSTILYGTEMFYDNIEIYDRGIIATNDVNISNQFVVSNPVIDYLTIRCIDADLTWSCNIMDIHGKRIYKSRNNREDIKVEVGGLSQGIYFYEIIDQNNLRFSGKVVVVK